MRILLVAALLACLMTFTTNAPAATSDSPKREFWIGSGVAAISEKSLFNVPNEQPWQPDPFVSLNYYRNFDSHRALGFHFYGGTALDTRVTLPDGQIVPYTMSAYNLGARYRHTFRRGRFAAFAFVGCSWSSGSLEREGVPDLNYSGFSACAGVGDAIRLGRHVMVLAEGMVSPGTANWASAPFPSSSDTKIDPSLASATLHLGYVWGSTEPATPGKGASGIGKGVGIAAGFVLTEGLIVLNAGMAAATPLGYGILFILLSPLAAGDVQANSRAEKIVTIATFESIGVFNLIMSAGEHSEDTIFIGNVIAWNAAIGITWAARKTVFKPRPAGGGAGKKEWSAEPDIVGGAPGLRVDRQF